MTDIDIQAKTDRELLIMLVDKQDEACRTLEKHDKWINGNGLPGAKFQIWVMWAAFIVLIAKVI